MIGTVTANAQGTRRQSPAIAVYFLASVPGISGTERGCSFVSSKIPCLYALPMVLNIEDQNTRLGHLESFEHFKPSEHTIIVNLRNYRFEISRARGTGLLLSIKHHNHTTMFSHFEELNSVV